jgi:hypothetical protein
MSERDGSATTGPLDGPREHQWVDAPPSSGNSVASYDSHCGGNRRKRPCLPRTWWWLFTATVITTLCMIAGQWWRGPWVLLRWRSVVAWRDRAHIDCGSRPSHTVTSTASSLRTTMIHGGNWGAAHNSSVPQSMASFYPRSMCLQPQPAVMATWSRPEIVP